MSGVQVRVRIRSHHGFPASNCGARPAWAQLVLSGDLGQYNTPILKSHAFESATCIDGKHLWQCRHRGREDTERELGGILAQAARDGGNVLVPAFAIGRSQELLYLLARHYADWQLDRWRIFLDSPMAIAASRVYWKHPDRYDEEAARMRAGYRGMPPLPNLVLSETPDDSRAINNVRGGAIVIAGSGMANGGRILHHLKHNLERPECHVVIVGFQAPGTLGRRLVDREPVFITRRLRCASRYTRIGGLSPLLIRPTCCDGDSFKPRPRILVPVKCPRPKHWRKSSRLGARRRASAWLADRLADLKPLARDESST